MRDIAFTARVNVTLPVIAKAGSAATTLEPCSASGKAKLGGHRESCRAVPKRESVAGTRALRPPQKTVSHGGTATGKRDWRDASSDAIALRRLTTDWKKGRPATFAKPRGRGNGRPFAVSKGVEIHA